MGSLSQSLPPVSLHATIDCGTVNCSIDLLHRPPATPPHPTTPRHTPRHATPHHTKPWRTLTASLLSMMQKFSGRANESLQFLGMGASVMVSRADGKVSAMHTAARRTQRCSLLHDHPADTPTLLTRSQEGAPPLLQPAVSAAACGALAGRMQARSAGPRAVSVRAPPPLLRSLLGHCVGWHCCPSSDALYSTSVLQKREA